VPAQDTVPRTVPVASTLGAHAPTDARAPASKATSSATALGPISVSPSPPSRQQPPSSSSSAPTSTPATKLRIDTTTPAAMPPRQRVHSPASAASSRARASPAPSSSVKPPRRRIVETETPPPGRGSTPLTRHRASSEVKPAPSSDAPEIVFEGARAGSVTGRAGTSVGTSANAARATATPLESAPSTPAGSSSAAASKKKTRRGWKGWAIEVVDEDGNTFIRSPSPEPEPDPNQPRRGRGRPRKNPAPVGLGESTAHVAYDCALTTAPAAPADAAPAAEAEAEAEAEVEAAAQPAPAGVAEAADAVVDPAPVSGADDGIVGGGSPIDTSMAVDDADAAEREDGKCRRSTRLIRLDADTFPFTHTSPLSHTHDTTLPSCHYLTRLYPLASVPTHSFAIQPPTPAPT
jgi:hypothetical protein